MSGATTFERIGGSETVESVVDEFYDRVLDGDRGAHRFEGTDTEALRTHQVQFVSAVAGGPVEYTGQDMREAHRGMGITDEEFDVVAGHLDAALSENGVSDEELERVLAEVEELRPQIFEGGKE